MILKGLAQYLNNEGIGIFDEIGDTSTITLNQIPDVDGLNDDVQIALYDTSIGEQPVGVNKMILTVDYGFKILVRGGSDTEPVYNKAKEIYDLLHGLSRTTLPNSDIVNNVISTKGQPEHIGMTEKGQHEYIISFRAYIPN